ncbi:MAG: vWA domain-containing protein [Halanaerobiaceae bacterium]
MKFNFSKIKSFHILLLFLLVLGFFLGSHEEIYRQGAKKVTTYETGIENRETETYLEIIWDASGSMWGKNNDTRKITQAKEVLDYINSNLPDNIYTGLRIFGARRISDEKDSFLAVPFEKNNNNKIKNYIKNIKPLGRSPIELSLKKAGKDLENFSGERHILLISDGISNQEISEQEVIDKLNESDIKFHVFHLGEYDNDSKVDEEDMEDINVSGNLITIADHTNGNYFSENNNTAEVVKTFSSSR